MNRAARGVTAGAFVTIGFLAVFGSAGVLIELGMHLIISWVPWAMILVALAMVVLGVQGLAGGHVRLRLPSIRFGSGSGFFAVFGFGVAYAVASLSCALPLFLAGVAGAFTRLGMLTGGATFLAYALGMGVFVTALSVVAAVVGPASVRRLRRVGRFIPRVASVIILLVGAYLLFYWIVDIVNPLSMLGPVRAMGAIQSAISSALSAEPLVVGALAGVPVIFALAWVALGVFRHARPHGAPHAQEGAYDD